MKKILIHICAIVLLMVVIIPLHELASPLGRDFGAIVMSKDTIKRDIPDIWKSKSYRKIKRKIEKLAGLNTLENGYSELQIRIWISHSNSIEQLIILRKTNDKWDAEIDTLTFEYDKASDTLVSINKIAQRVLPVSGWKSFTANLFKLKILSLPDMSQLPGYRIENDGKSITVETATKGTYRIYTYYNPEGYKKKFWQANNIVSISRLIDKELKIK